MKFTLEIDIPEAELDQFGHGYTVRGYLRETANRAERLVSAGYTAGVVRDDNGNAIGKWVLASV